MKETLKVDVWSDVACPWCYIGKRKFEEGLRRYAAAGGDRLVELEYHSFELSPDTPVDFEGSEIDFLARHKGIPAEQARQLLAHVTETAATVGLAFDFGAMKHTNTLKAHQVLHLAKKQGVQVELKERFLKAYFEEGRHLGHDDELARLAFDVGLDPTEVVSSLASGQYRDAVTADIEQAHGYGISAVPFFVFDSRYGVSGAQDPQVFKQVLQRASDESSAPTPSGAPRR